MPSSLFSRDSRVLLCTHCGAPLDVHVEDGDVRCEHCHAVVRFARRDEQQDAAERHAGEALAIGEPERLDLLRAQDHQPSALVPPPSLEPFLKAGEVPGARVRSALAHWVALRRRVQASDPLGESSQLFHLTLLLAPRLDARDERALLESALEALSDKRHRQVLRCRLAEGAVLAGDCQAAAEWLETCNQRCTDLHADSAFRLAACCVATARGAFGFVLELLGSNLDEVPIIDGRDVEAAILRANALERSGQLDSARQQLVALVQRDARFVAGLRDAAARFHGLSVCPRSFTELYEPLLALIDRALRPEAPSAGRAWLGLLGAGVLAVVLLCLWGLGLSTARPSTFFFWAGACAAGLAAAVGLWARSRGRFAREAKLGFARVVSSSSDATGHYTLRLELLTPTGAVPTSTAVSCKNPVPPGVYPCLMDAAGRHVEICVETPPLDRAMLASAQEAPVPGSGSASRTL